MPVKKNKIKIVSEPSDDAIYTPGGSVEYIPPGVPAWADMENKHGLIAIATGRKGQKIKILSPMYVFAIVEHMKQTEYALSLHANRKGNKTKKEVKEGKAFEEAVKAAVEIAVKKIVYEKAPRCIL